ncbi:MAG: terminase family protein [Thermodesulfobacteriota bacterium]
MTDFLTSTMPSTAKDTDAAPPVLLPYQQRWIADDSQLKIAEKGRRTGLTWAEASDDVLIAAAARGSNVFYISATQDMALEYIEACAMWARAFDQAAGEIEEGIFKDGDKEIKTYKIDFPKSGRRIVALSSRPTNLRGKQGVIIIDEAAFHNDLAGMLKAAMAMLLWGDKVRIISTHNGVDNPFNELIQQVRAGKRKGSVHRIAFREAVEQGLYRRVCLRRGIEWSQDGEDAWVTDAYAFYGDDAAEELDAVPSQSGGAYLSMGLIEARMNEATPLVRGKWTAEFGHLPDHVREAEVKAWCEENLEPVLAKFDRERAHGFGEDFGRLGDLTVIDVIEEGRDLVNRVKLQVELSNCPFRQQEQILCYIVDRLPLFRSGVLDARGNGQYLAERAAQRYGSMAIEQVMLSDAFYLEHMPRFKAALQDGTLDDIPKDVEIRDDLRALRVMDGVPKLPKAKTQKGDGPKLQRHGDSAISLFLGHYAMLRDVVEIDWTEAPKASLGFHGEAAGSDDNDDDYALAGGGAW